MNIDGKTKLLGLIGTPVEHSKSPAMYNYCFDKYGKKKWVQRSGNIPGHFALVPIYKSDSAQPDPVLQFQ